MSASNVPACSDGMVLDDVVYQHETVPLLFHATALEILHLSDNEFTVEGWDFCS